jgi:hypothetical protein
MAQLRAQIALDSRNGRRPFQSLSPAPQRFWRMYEKADPAEVLELKDAWLGRILKALRFQTAPVPLAQVSLAFA